MTEFSTCRRLWDPTPPSWKQR